MSQYAYMIALLRWIETGKLVSIEEAQNTLGCTYFFVESSLVVGKDAQKSEVKGIPVQLELEDYLLGICNLPNELARFSVNCVTAGNYVLPIKISKFVADVYAGFR